MRLVPVRGPPLAGRIDGVPSWLTARTRFLIGALGLACAAAALLLGLSVEPLTGVAIARATAEALAIGLPVLIGLYALQRDPAARFARLLLFSGLAWAPTMLANTDAALPYSIGRVWGWGIAAWIVYLLLAFPVGRLATRSDRWLVGSAVACFALLYLPTALFADFPLPSPWTQCQGGCPSNVFMVTGSQPAVVTGMTVLRDVLGWVIYSAAALSVAARWIGGSRVVRKAYGPVFVFAVVNLAAAGVFLAKRQAGTDLDGTEIAGLVTLLATPIFALAFVGTLLKWRFVAHGTWRQLTPHEQMREGDASTRDVMAEAIQDPSLEIGYWGDAQLRWITEAGEPFALPAAGPVRAVTEVTAEGQPIAVLVHESSYATQSGIREVVQGIALMALINQRLEAVARAKLAELTDSRARIVEAIDKDRLRVERDLHDGAQQRLIALKVTADRGAEVSAGGTDRTAELFQRIGTDAAAALEEVRSLARGIYPPLLVDHGLAEALNDAATRSAVRTRVRARGIARYPQEIESAVYFCCLEALQNAEKHAHAHALTITLRGGAAVNFEIRDDGEGFDVEAASEGLGLRNMRDRVEAVGGKLRVESVIGGGTLIAGSVPTASHQIPAELQRLVLHATDALEDAMGVYRAIRTASGTIVDFAIEYLNDSARTRSGLSPDAQIAKTLGQLDPDYVRSDSFRWHRDALAAAGPLVREEVEYVGTVNARRIHAAWETRAVALGADRLAVLWHDITEATRDRTALEMRAHALAREGAGVCVVRSSSGAIVYANDRLERMFGYGPGELEGRPAADLEIGEWESRAPVSDDGFEARCRRKDGSLIWCEVVMDGFEDRDLGWCWVSVHRDVTLRKQEAAERDQLADQMKAALKGLRALAWSADRDLQTTLLFDNVHVDAFGADVADHITELSRRVLVTGRPVRADIDVGTPDPLQLTFSADPVLASDGSIAGVVGNALDRGRPTGAATLTGLPGGASSRLQRLRRER